ncbi:4Fe-4S ferredoxin iron-sulfur binding domain-containing protein [Candidatus Magnetomorum sp. HK-1]|nr:4Fe-4S ferredoxin iron-sulfur binding domain-containing protein [Candidatus Magnetomorum sp. HK-1]
MIKYRRFVQYLFLFLFITLLGLATIDIIIATDFFLKLDPALMFVSAISARSLTLDLLMVGLLLLVTLIFGRLFCSYICPMGTIIDFTDNYIKPKKYQLRLPIDLHYFKYYVLVFIFGAALLGISLVYWVSPISLITRFFGLVLYPVITLISGKIVEFIHPLADLLDLRTIMFLEIKNKRFDTQYFIIVYFILIFFAAKFSPRFWCRYLCPSGAILALFSQKPLIRRNVNQDCTQCGVCSKKCPMNAIKKEKAHNTNHSNCIVCRTCEFICPEKAIQFSFKTSRTNKTEVGNSDLKNLYARRQFLLSGFAGMGTAAVSMTNIKTVTEVYGDSHLRTARLLRPPAALPEKEFLSLCVRCGECIAICPSNTLQPIWFQSGFLAAFSPVIVPRLKYCDPRCHRCASVCPTGAIRSLSTSERIWAKIGTAIINRRKCLAWEYDKSCMVCDEVCPFDAVDFKIEPSHPYPVPRVIEDKCAGCGYCEHFCPVQNEPAILITPMNALRLTKASYKAEGSSRGYHLRLKTEKEKFDTQDYQQENNNRDNNFLAPGFDQG